MKLWSRFLIAVLGLVAVSAAFAQPSITPSGVSVSPVSAAPGEQVTVSITATNGGAATPADDMPVGGTVTGYVTFRHKVVTSTTLDCGTIALPVTFSTTAIVTGAGGTGTFTRSFTVPTQISDVGAYDATVTLTGASAGGSGAGSFTSPSVLTVTGKPDFQITSITYTAGTNYTGGSTLPMTLTYRNNSASNGTNNVPYDPSIHASYFRINIVLSTNATYGDADDFFLTFHDISSRALADSATKTINWTQLLPGNYAGSYYVLAKIDSLDAIDETIENDTTINGNNIWGDLAATRIALQPTAFATNYLASTTGATGSASGNGYSDNPAVSGDGRYTVFASDATNLVSGDTNGVRDIFLFDNNTSSVRRINLSQQGAAANGASNNPAIASAGRYVAFSSEATNLILGDTNGFPDIFVVDTQTGSISRESVATAGTQSDGASFRPSISSDGRYIVFESSATNLAGSTTAGLTQIYLRDRTSSTTTLVSQSTGGAAGNGNSLQAVISSDGTYVAFASDATNLVADTNGVRDVFLRSLAASTTIRVSVGPGGAEATGGASRQPSISSDGSYVAFASDAADLVPLDANLVSDVFVYDRAAASTARVSISSTGAEGNDPTSVVTTGSKLGSFNPAISATGRYVAFVSLDSDLAPGDTFGQYIAGGSGNGALNVYVHDRDTTGGTTFNGSNISTRIASVNRFGYQTGRANISQSTAAADIYPAISADGRWIAVPSDAESSNGLIHNATNMTSPDANNARDVVVIDRRINQLPGSATLPTVAITSPGNSSTSLVNTTVTISASATTTIGVISNVQFYVNGTTVGTSTVFPYSATWTPTAVGTYTLSALATDSLGNVGASTNVSVTINAAPSVGLTSPVGGTLVPVNSATTVTASASASTPGATIASVQFYANGVAIGAADTIAPFSASWTPTSSGTYSLTATATDSAGVQATSTAVSVSAGVAPSSGIVSPANGATVAVNTTQTVLANVSSSTGVVASVTFFANGVSIGTDGVYPFTATWTPTSPGTYSLTAVATDNVGNTTTSSANSITVSASAVTPTVSITAPTAGSAVALNATSTITVNATSPIGAPASVQFFANAVSIGTSTTAPFSLAWTPTTAGAASLTATITDSVGTTATSTAVAVTVGTGPVVAVTAPSTGANIPVNTSTTLLATATSAASTIATVQFFANGVAVGTANTFPYATSWTPTAAGSYSLTARATDAAGNISTSPAIAVNVTSSLAPTVAITAPAASATLPINVATTLTSTTSTPVGSVASVQYLVNSTSVGTSTTAPFSLSWTPTTAGAASITAVVTNTLGTQTTSAAVATTVGTGPSVAISAPTAGAVFIVNSPETLLATASANVAGTTIASVQFLVNGVAIGSVSTFPYQGSWTPTTTGSYSLRAIATDTAGNQTTSSAVNVTVIPNTAGGPPTVAITAPVSGTVLPINAATTLTVNAATPSGSIASVQYFANGAAIGTSTTSPFSLAWTPVVGGAVSLVAVATTNIGTATTSSAIAINVNIGTLPTVAITAPGSATILPVNTPLTVTATASGSSNATVTVPITSVQFFVTEGALTTALGTDGVFPYNASWTPVATGSYTLTALVTDAIGNTASTATTVTVASPTPGAPSVSVVSPPSGTTMTVNQTVVLSAIASDPDGAVTLVEFLDNGAVVGSKATAPYFVTYTPTTNGAHAFTAVVTDNDGNRVTSAASNVTVAAASGTPPTTALFFNNPALDATATAADPFAAVDVSVGSTLILTGVGASTSGTIQSVQFFVNGVSIATDAASPFYTTHQLGTIGQVVISALVTDSLGNRVFTVPLFLNGRASISASASLVSLISPVNAATYVVGENIVFNATHNFGTDTPPKIDFYINGTAATTVSAPPYQFIRGLTRSGTYDVHAVVRSDTTTSVSTMAQITVNSNTAPSVSITNPVTASSTAIGTGMTIAASASDPDGTIQSVQFFANGASLATVNTFPYTTPFNPGATGVYQLRALATDNSGNQTLSSIVSVTVTAGSLPSVAITSPATSTRALGSIIDVVATATSNVTGATIASVQFFANGLSIGTDTTFPYGVTFTPSATGTYALTATAIDTAGNQATSAVITLTMAANVVPTASITAPATGSTVGVGSTNTVTATAADSDGTITSVAFSVSYNGGTAASLGTVTAAPYQVSWTPRIAGSYVLTAVATDNLGAVNTVAATSTITVAGGNAPNATVSAPALVAVNSNATISATANAVAPGATIASVQFLANNVLIGSDAIFPYSITFSPTATGAYSVQALVTDTFGNQTLTAGTTVTVAANNAPTISLAASATSGVGASNTITATTSDTDGSVASVQFLVSFNGGTPVSLGIVTSPSAPNTYTLSWTPTIAGSYSLTAIATDNVATTTTSNAVAVAVSGGAAPTVAVSSPTNGTIVAANSSNTITATATANTVGATIANVQFFANGVALGTDATFPYTAAWTPSATGTYSLTALATDSNGAQATSTAISVSVQANVAPTVSVTVPANLGVGVAGTLTANAADADGTIASVQFFANGTAIGTPIATAPYTMTFTSNIAGTIAITASATDNLGTTTTSAPSTITVSGGNAPTVTITAPANLSTVPVNVTQSVTATAIPVVGTIASVEFRVTAGGTTTTLGSDSTFPYATTWTPTSVGTYTLTAVATDTSGNQAVGSATITVTATSNAGPSVSLVSPANASTYTANTGVVLFANASDSNGTVTSVRFLVDGQVIGTPLTSPPYTTVWTPTAAGTRSITAIAVDNDFNATVSNAATVNVNNPSGTAPTVAIVSPATGAILTTQSIVPLAAGVSTSAVNSVTFYDNGVALGAAITSAPFATTYAPATPGSHRIYAIATDPSGNVVVSVPVDLIVNAATSPLGPTVTLTSPTNGATVSIGTTPAATVTLAATATDGDGTITQVQFFVNGVLAGTDVDFPYSVIFTPTSLGTYTVTATATDNAGNVRIAGSSATFTTTPANAPVVTITNPIAGSILNGGVATTITATVLPAAGRTITSPANVRFYVGGVQITGTVVSAGANAYSIPYTPPTAGASLDLTAQATDDNSVTGVSPVVTVTLATTPPPTVSISSPVAGSNLTVGVAQSVVVTAGVAPGLTVASAQLFVGGVGQPAVISPGTSFTLPFTPSGAANNVALTVRVTDSVNGTTTSLPVVVNFVTLAGPTVALTAPTAGGSIVIGTPTSVTATATPIPGATITDVRFFAGSTLIGTSNVSPATITWLPTVAGVYPLTVVARDSNNNSTTSAVVSVTVTAPLASITINSPTGGSILPVNTPTTITASAGTSTGTVVSVEFLANGISLSTDTTFPFAAPWTPTTPGIYALTARATDNFGTVSNSPIVTVTVAAGNVPTVAISSPASQSTVTAGTSQIVVVNALAANGTITQVELFANGVSLGVDSTFPYNFPWTPGGVGNVSLTAVATDSQGTVATSPAVGVIVTGISASAPTVSVSSPTAGSSLPVGVPTLVGAIATDVDGTIAQVEFFANGTSLGVDSVFPYNVTFTPGATGTYVITARATDNGGNIATSAAVSVSVTGGTAPSVAITAPTSGAVIGVSALQTITATATSPSGFIASVQFFLNGVALSTDTTFPYAADWTPGAVGTYTLTARATDNLGNITDSAVVVVTVGASAAPTVSLTNPASGSSYTVGTPLTIAADAADSDGTIAQVQFFVNGAPLSTDLVSPYSAAWTTTSVGIYTLTARATDNNGNVTTSAPITVTIGANAAPTIALTSPVAGSYSLGNLVLVSANANDSDGTVASVQFFANGLAIGTATTAPFSTSWRPTLAGTFSITAQATDNVGNVAVTPPVSVTITSTAAPVVTITNPVVGTAYGVGNAIPFTASTAGGNGPIAQVQFFVNGTALGAPDNTSPYSATWTPNAPGTYLLLAIATDSAGLSSSTSSTMNITIAGNNAPTVALTSPLSGTSVNGGATVNLTAVASDSDGTVASVRFIANGNVVGTATAIPYSSAWVPSAPGNYTVTAQATDNSGNVTNSAAITVTVVSNRAPVVTLTAPGNGATVRVGAGTTLSATATDADGTIASVAFFANGLAIGSPDTTAPYSATWTPGAEGIYRITATALDNSGAATVSSQITVLAVIPGANGSDVVYTGQYQGLGESGRFAAINVRGTNATFIGFSTTTPSRVYFYPGLPVDTNGGFASFDGVGRSIISGTASDTGATGTLDAGRVTFIGTVGFGGGASVASGYYSGNLNGRSDSTFVAIVGPDGTIAIYAADGAFRDAGSGTVGATGNFTVTTATGTRFVGRADPATGFLTGTLTGGPGGGFMAAIASGVSFSDGFLKNLSTRGQVGTGSNILIAGFIVAGDSPKQVLIRAIGPSLSTFGVAGALADTQLQLFNGNTLVASNDNWGGAADVSTASNLAGAFPLSPSSLDSVIFTALPPGSYTAQVSGVGGRTGVALIELYDTDNLQPFSAQKVTNVATRGVVGSGQGQLIAGFVVSGNTSKKVLIRAVGPTLGAAPFNVGGVLADPLLRLVRADNLVVRENDNWEMGNDAALINEASSKVGAFPLAAGGRDAAMLINLPPGTYSAQVTGPGTATGVALVEVYEVP